MIMKKALPRRTFLRGAGTALALPLLDAMIPSLTALADTPANPARLRRLGFVYMPMGCDLTRWIPPGGDTLDEFSPTLSPLASVKKKIAVISNLELRNAYPGTHATSNCAFLSAATAKRTESTDYHLGTTVDQIAARHIGRDTPLPSLELSMDLLSMVGQCDNGYACVYQNNLSWSSPTTPLPSEAHPRIVFENLFGEEGGAADRRAALKKRSSADHARLMFDLQVLALQADITRVITFQLARETSNRTYTEIGISEPHHPLTHHGNDPDKIAKVAKINQFHVSLFAGFLQKLESVREGNGSLLDHVLYLYGSGMGNPNVHDHVNLPIIVAGGAAGNMQGGRHIRYREATPLANLHLTLLDKVGVRLDSFADSNGQVDELFKPISI